MIVEYIDVVWQVEYWSVESWRRSFRLIWEMHEVRVKICGIPKGCEVLCLRESVCEALGCRPSCNVM